MYRTNKIHVKTHYFNPESTKAFVNVPNPDAYCNEIARQEEYQTRIYVEYEYTKSLCGKVFYYTLTYNDEALPTFYGVPCFDFKNLRYLLNGQFYRYIRKEWRCRIKYFITCETGEGKGKRGIGNNPHYHCLFFLTPDSSSSKECHMPSALEFRSLVQRFWQGFSGLGDYKKTKFGIACEGSLNNGEVLDNTAGSIGYCTKYIIKDVNSKKALNKVYARSIEYNTEFALNHWKFKAMYLLDVCKDEPDINSWSIRKLIRQADCSTLKEYVETMFHRFFGDGLYFLSANVRKYLLKDTLVPYEVFIKPFVRKLVSVDMQYYRSFCGPRVRVSHKFGTACLDSLRQCVYDGKELKIRIQCGNEFKYRVPGSFYIRNLFYDVVKNEDNQVMYVINELGLKYFGEQIDARIEKKVAKYRQLVDKVRGLPYFGFGFWKWFNRYAACDSDIIPKVLLDGISLQYILDNNYFMSLYSKVNLYDVARYALVYHGRCFLQVDGLKAPSVDIASTYKVDYKAFIKPAYYDTRFKHLETLDDINSNIYLRKDNIQYVPYYCHDDLKDIALMFYLLELFDDYFICCSDVKRRKEDDEVKIARKFHSLHKFNQKFLLNE